MLGHDKETCTVLFGGMNVLNNSNVSSSVNKFKLLVFWDFSQFIHNLSRLCTAND